MKLCELLTVNAKGPGGRLAGSSIFFFSIVSRCARVTEVAVSGAEATKQSRGFPPEQN